MKLRVLVDNNTLIGEYYYGEPGLAFYIEEAGNKILFDLGYSGICIRNAFRMGIDINKVNIIVLSHGHLDHTWGLTGLMESLKASIYQNAEKKISVITHPFALCPKMDNGEPIGFMHSEAVLNNCFNVKLSKSPEWISEKLCFLGQIERVMDFENKKPIGTTIIDGAEQEDHLLDDSAMVYKTEKGLVIITGCSHSGICNIIEYAKKICQDDRVLDIIGGLHLLSPSAERLENTLDYLKELKPHAVHACHCTDLASKIELSKVLNVKEVGVGLTLDFD